MAAFLEIFKPYDAQVASFTLTSLTAIVLWIIQARVKLRWGFQHGFSHRVDPRPSDNEADRKDGTAVESRPIMVRTASYWIANEGRRPASNVEVTFNFHPANYSIWPQRNYQTAPNPEGRLIFKFSSLSPKEAFTINLINIGSDIPGILSIRSDEATGKEIPIVFVKQYNKWVYFTMAGLILIGFFSFIYFILSLVL